MHVSLEPENLLPYSSIFQSISRSWINVLGTFSILQKRNRTENRVHVAKVGIILLSIYFIHDQGLDIKDVSHYELQLHEKHSENTVLRETPINKNKKAH